MANIIYGAIALTGGTEGALDALDGASLNDGDGALVLSGGWVYFYKLDAASGQDEDVPLVIAPDLNAGTKRWILQRSALDGEGLTTSDLVSYGGTIPEIDAPLDLSWNSTGNYGGRISLKPTGDFPGKDWSIENYAGQLRAVRADPEEAAVLAFQQSGILSLPLQSRCVASLSNTLIVTAHDTVIELDTIEEDTQSEFDSVNHRFTAALDGIYLFTCSAEVYRGYSSTSYYQYPVRIKLVVNGSAEYDGGWSYYMASASSEMRTYLTLSRQIKLTAGDYAELVFDFKTLSYIYEITKCTLEATKIA